MDLHEIADRIPSMGGTEIGSLLRRVARDAPAETSVVEVGCWLGAGTAQLALGLRERQGAGSVQLHCYDRWHANESEVGKATRWAVELSVGEDTLPQTRRTLEPFEIPIHFHKGDVGASRWDGGPISVYVDDASKKWQAFYHVLLTFGPSWMPGETVVVLMDYHIWKSTGAAEHQCQKEFVESNHSCFEPIEHVGQPNTEGCLPTQPAVFLYRAPVDFGKWVATRCMGSLAAAQEEIKSLSGQVRQRDEKLHELKSSTSWRITAPLRRCVDGARQLVHSGPRSPSE